MSKMSEPGWAAPGESGNEDDFIFEAMARAIAKAGVCGVHERDSLAQALAGSGATSLGDLRVRLITSGTPEDVFDNAVKAGIVARAAARFDFGLEAIQRLPAFQERSPGLRA